MRVTDIGFGLYILSGLVEFKVEIFSQMRLTQLSLIRPPPRYVHPTELNGITRRITMNAGSAGLSAFIFSVHFVFPFLDEYIRDNQHTAVNLRDNHDHAIDHPTILSPLIFKIPCAP